MVPRSLWPQDGSVVKPRRPRSTLPWAAVVALLMACGDGESRGRSEPSPDGGTYLVLDDDSGGGCAILVDGAPWQHAIGTPGQVSAGPHEIACGHVDGGISFVIQPAPTFHFDYWGP